MAKLPYKLLIYQIPSFSLCWCNWLPSKSPQQAFGDSGGQDKWLGQSVWNSALQSGSKDFNPLLDHLGSYSLNISLPLLWFISWSNHLIIPKRISEMHQPIYPETNTKSQLNEKAFPSCFLAPSNPKQQTWLLISGSADCCLNFLSALGKGAGTEREGQDPRFARRLVKC